MPFGRVSIVTLSIALCVALLATLLPAAVFAAQDTKVREYIVTLDVKDSGRNIKPSNRASKVRIRQRASAANEETKAVTKRNGVKARHRYGNAVTGFSARMTKAEARKMARDPSVSNVRVARTFKIAGETLPVGVKRVKAYQGSPQPDVNAHVAVLDTGIGPSSGGSPIAMTSNELNIAGGINCYDDPDTPIDETSAYPGYWGDVDGHGTHVAGTIGARANGVGAIGVAPGADLWAVRVFGSDGYGSEAAIVCGLDWVAGTHSNATPDIDVVNMSIQGPRLDDLEDCGAIVGNPAADPMQQSVCVLKTMGVPVVASAGNYGIDANNSSPGGYDQVISVGAITDTDGEGWERGNNAGCSSRTAHEQDDTFASYSNHGPDIDIVAPGTCVWSTWYADPSGDTLVTSTGTSMAAPHVTGAIARYIDARGNPSSVGEMRQLIRAAGRMDWDAKTDPVWFGVHDENPPNRVLDVAALTAGSSAVKTFVYHENLVIGGSDPSRATRVDVQRSGGFDGNVHLSTVVPGGLGSSTSFDTTTLSGLDPNDLGTTLTFAVDPNGDDGVRDVDVIAGSNQVAPHSRALELTVDRTAPKVSDLRPKIRGGRVGVTLKGTTEVFIQWAANDALTGVASARLQRMIGTGSWKYGGVAGASSARVSLKPGQSNKFRVKVTDGAGNSKSSYSIGGRLSIRDSKSSSLEKSGSWRTNKSSKAYRGSVLVATAGKATVETTFAGSSVAVLAPIGPGRGKFRVRIDGGAWRTVNTKASSAAQRKVVWSTRMAKKTHTLEIQRVSGRPALDGVIIVH